MSCCDSFGKHKRKLMNTTRLRGSTSAYKAQPKSQPNVRTQASGKCAKRRITQTPQRLTSLLLMLQIPGAGFYSAHNPINTAEGTEESNLPAQH